MTFFKQKAFFIVLLGAVSTSSNAIEYTKNNVTTTVSSGYVFKSAFSEEFRGIQNLITIDTVCPLFNGKLYFTTIDTTFGIGSTISYWYTSGTRKNLSGYYYFSRLQEIPITVYFQDTYKLSEKVEGYGSLGGGIKWAQETSEKKYSTTKISSIIESELGVNINLLLPDSLLTFAIRFLCYPSPSDSLFHTLWIEPNDIDLRVGFVLLF